MKYVNDHEEAKYVGEPDHSGTYNAEDYLSWTFEGMVELIRGKIHRMSPAPSSNHQVLGDLFIQFGQLFRDHPCEVWIAPFDVYLAESVENFKKTGNVVQPDICIICDTSKVRDLGCIGTPDFILEVISPYTQKKDIVLKHELYEEYGIREYWVVYPKTKTIDVHVLGEDKKFHQVYFPVDAKTLSPMIFPGITIDFGTGFCKSPIAC